jgi:hypothetical protein
MARIFNWRLVSQFYFSASALLCCITGFIFFSHNKILSLVLPNIFIMIICFPYFFFCERKTMYLIVIPGFGLVYMTGLKFFFELFFNSIYNKYHSLLTILFPYIIKFLQHIYWIIHKLDLFNKKFYTKVKIFSLVNLKFFEFMSIATLHMTVVLKGFDYSIWVNLFISFLIEL